MPRGDRRNTNSTTQHARATGAEYHDYYDLIFRGYGDNDKIERKNNAKLNSFTRVSRSDDLFAVFKPNVVMVDVDDMDASNKIKQILDDLGTSHLYQNTTRGKHFFFKHGKYSRLLKDKNKILTAVGIPVDYKCYDIDGTKLVKEGQSRPVLTSNNFTELEDLPYWLIPSNCEQEFLNLKQGNRNEDFYIYILQLLRCGLDKEQVKHTITLINSYVLAEPLNDRELKIILRDDAFPTQNEVFIYKQAGKRTASLDYELFAKYLIEKNHIIKINSRLYVYCDGVYVMLDQDKLNELVMRELKNTTKSMRAELKEYITNYAEEKEQSSYNYILFKNCIYDIIHDSILPITPDFIFLNRINHNYIKDAVQAEIVDTTLDNLSCKDEEVRQLLLEIIGYTFYRRNKLGKFFILVGDGANGKSTYLDMIKNLLGENNAATVSLQELVTDKFAPWLLTDKLVDIGDDIDKEFVANTGKFKKLVTGESIIAQKKGQDQYSMSYYGKFIFSCNEIPRINDKTYGLKRRMVIVPLNAKFTEKDIIPFIDEMLQEKEAMEYILRLALEALRHVLTTGKFTIPQTVVDATEEYNIENDTILQYLEEYSIDQKAINDVYISYSVFCQESNVKPEGKQRFCKRIYGMGYDKKEVKVSCGSGRTSKYIFNLHENDPQGTL